LFYRPKRRMQFEHVHCPRHREECGILIRSTVPTVKELFICQKDFVTRDEMYAYVYSYYVSHYSIKTLGGSVVVTEHPLHQAAYFQFMKDYYTPASQTPLRAVTAHRNELRPADDKLHPIVDTISKLADQVVASHLCLRENKVMGGLEKLCLQRLSANFILTKKKSELKMANFHCIHFQLMI